MASKFELSRTKDSRYFFTLVGDDGTELLRGLPLFSKTQARKAAEAAQTCILDPVRVFKKESHGELYFTVHNAKDEMIARSPHMHSPLAIDEILEEAKGAVEKAIFFDASERKIG
jgi:uncharacterized protein YegP (UPF0339 family)